MPRVSTRDSVSVQYHHTASHGFPTEERARSSRWHRRFVTAAISSCTLRPPASPSSPLPPKYLAPPPELQLWHAVRTQLRSLERIRLAAVDKATLAEQIRSELVTSKEQRDTGDDYRSRKRKLDDICSDLKQKSLDEQMLVYLASLHAVKRVPS